MTEGEIIKHNGNLVKIKTKENKIYTIPYNSISKITANGKVHFELWKAKEEK